MRIYKTNPVIPNTDEESLKKTKMRSLASPYAKASRDKFLEMTRIKEFMGWFIAMILWLPTTIGGWLVHFNAMSMDNMWLASLGLSFVVALLSSCGMRKHQHRIS